LRGNKGDSTGGEIRRWGLAGIKEEVVDAGVDAGVEQISLGGDLFLPSVAKGAFSVGKVPMLDGFLYHRGMVMADLGYHTDVFKAGEGIVYQETLGKVGVETGEVVVFSRDSRGSSWAGMEDFPVNPLGGVHTSLDYGDASIEDIADVGAGLGVTPLIEIADGIVVGIGDIIFCPVLLDNTVGVFFIAIIFQGIFYCCYVTK